jgi:hypothetical protein
LARVRVTTMFDKVVSQNRDYYNFRLELLHIQLERCREQFKTLEEKEQNPTEEGRCSKIILFSLCSTILN